MKNNGKFIKISKEEIEKALETTTRQYLVGHLSLPQIIQHIDEKDVEIGISYYREDNSYEQAHWHPIQKEYQVCTSRSNRLYKCCYRRKI
jgi:hypothetical protein